MRNSRLSAALAAAAAFFLLSYLARFWSGELSPSPLWLATASTAAIALAVPRPLRSAVVLGGVVGGVFAGPLLFDDTLRTLVSPVAGNTLEVVLIVLGAQRFLGDRPEIRRTRDAAVLIVLVAVACAAGGLMATADTSSTVIGERVESWLRWTLGNIVGELHLLPFVLFRGAPAWFRRYGQTAAELALTVAIVGGLGALAFAADSPLTYLLVPSAMWIAIRFGPVPSTWVAFGSALAATFVSGQEVGPFSEFTTDPVLNVQAFNVAIGLSSIVGGAHALRAYTDQGRAGDSEQRWRQLSESAFDGIGRVDRRGVIVEANARLCAILGRREDEVVGRRVRDLVVDTDWPSLHRERARFADAEASSFETWIEDREHVRRWVRITTRPLETGGGFFVVDDVTVEHRERQERRAAEHRLETVERSQREQLARELHDGPVQSLSAAIVRLATLRRTNGDHDDLQLTQRIVEEAVDHLRNSLVSLAGDRSVERGFREEIESLVEQLRLGSTPTVELRIERTLPLGQDAARTLTDIGREAVANSLIHADATHIEVVLSCNDEECALVVRDDGVGFTLDDRPTPSHLGLRLMRTRAAELGGDLRIESDRSQGTTVHAVVPIPGR